MSITKHTSGPWRLIHKKDGDRLDAWVFAKDSTSTGRELQVIDMHDQHPIKEHLERRLADIKLICAAPELLEALQAMDDLDKLDHLSDEWWEQAEKADKLRNAAIKKATS